jgi:hypothetical protein
MVNFKELIFVVKSNFGLKTSVLGLQLVVTAEDWLDGLRRRL